MIDAVGATLWAICGSGITKTSESRAEPGVAGNGQEPFLGRGSRDHCAVTILPAITKLEYCVR